MVAWRFVQAPTEPTGNLVAGVAIRRFGVDGAPGGPETVGGLGVTDLRWPSFLAAVSSWCGRK